MGITFPCCEESDKDKTTTIQPVVALVQKTIKSSTTNIAETSKKQPSLRSIIQTSMVQKQGRGPQNYQSSKILGKGSYGKVVLAEQKATKKQFAMKIIPKSNIKEINLLQSQIIPTIRRNPFLTTILETFQNGQYIYIIMEYLSKGDLYFYSKKADIQFSEITIRGILTEIIIALQYLHRQGIVYRQLKPQNILITDDGHIKLTDYGLSKIIKQDSIETGVSTFFGSMEYMAPEVVNGTFDQRADLWAVGVLMYELRFKENPIQSEGRTNYTLDGYRAIIQDNIIQSKVNSKVGKMSYQFRDLLLKLLEIDPKMRISLDLVRQHPFFEGVDWSQVQQRQNPPPFTQLLKKNDSIKFRNVDAEKQNRCDVFKKHGIVSKNFSLKLFQFRSSK